MKLVRKGLTANSQHDRWLHPAEDRAECTECYGDDEDCRKCHGTGWLKVPEEEEEEEEGTEDDEEVAPGDLSENPRAEELALKLQQRLVPILGESLGREAARNIAMIQSFDDDGIYQPDTTLAEATRAVLAQRMAHPKTYRAEHMSPEMFEAAIGAVASLNEQERLEPNRTASTLGGRPSMRTTFGRDIDPDRYKDRRGKDLDAAMNRYETFHAKRPLRIVELPHDLPSRVVPVGQVVSTMYRTDKWHEDGDDEDYKHVHDNSRGGTEHEYEFGKGVIAYEPAHQAKLSRVEGRPTKNFAGPIPSVRLPVQAPKALALLGYCLGVFVQRFDDEEPYETNPRGCYLLASPKGDMLAIYSPEEQPDGTKGFMMIMAGGKLRVLKEGIDG